MAKLRKFVAYRRLERPFTRISKYREQSYVRTRPHLRIARFETGEASKFFPYSVHLASKDDMQIRDNALESGRQAGSRELEKKIGKGLYHFKVRVYPHHILRENPLAAGAGADRMSTGMSHSFGKSIGVAARLRKGQQIFTARVNKEGVEAARQALLKVSSKMPCRCTIIVEENKKE